MTVYLSVLVEYRVIFLHWPISSVGFDSVSLWFLVSACTLCIVVFLDRASLKLGVPLYLARVYTQHHYIRNPLFDKHSSFKN